MRKKTNNGHHFALATYRTRCEEQKQHKTFQGKTRIICEITLTLTDV